MRTAPFLSAVLAAALAAQDVPPTASRDPRAVRSHALASQFACVAASHDEVLAVGHRWRALFGADDLTFWPALGRNAAAAAPVRLRLAAIRRGDGTAIELRPPRRESDRQQVSFQRGAALETWRATPPGLELSVTFPHRLPGNGDLVVHLQADTGLHAETMADGTLRWWRAGAGGASLGAVTGIDATGRTAPGSLRPVADGVELVLPGDFVATAAYPLVLDPLLGPAFEALPGYDSDFPDLAWDAASDTFCLCWTQFAGGGISDVVGAVFGGGDLQLRYAFAVNQPGNEDSIRVAAIRGVGAFVLAWCNQTAPGGPITITGMALLPGQAQGSALFAIAGPGNVDTPALSGEATVFDDDCLCIWDDDTFGICGSTVTVGPGLQVALGPIVGIGGGSSATEPAISKQGGNPGIHVVTWVDRPPGLNGWIRAQAVDHDLNLLGPGVWLRDAAEDAGRPALDGDGFLFLCAWQEQETVHTAATDLRGRTFTVSTAGITSRGPVIDLAAEPGRSELAPDVALLGGKFGLVWQSARLSQPWQDDAHAAVLERNGTLCGPVFRLELNGRSGYVYEHAPRILGRRDGDASTTAHDGLIVFGDQSTTTGDSDIGVQVVAAMGPGGTVADLGGGCGPAGLCATSGPCALGNVDFRVELFGAGTLAVPFLSTGLPGAPLLCGACALTTPVGFQFAPSSGGQASAPFPLPCNAAFVGITVEFQWVTFQNAYVGCPVAPGMAASNRVRATLGL